MAGLFILFLVVVAICDMLSGFIKVQEEVEDSDTPAIIIFTPDDDVYEWESAPKY